MNIGSLAYLGNNGNGAGSFRGSSSYVGNVCAKYTRGDDKTNFTFMAGIGFSSILVMRHVYTQNAYNQAFVRKNNNSYYLNASLFHRISKNSALVSEGWLVPKSKFGVLGMGIRTFKFPERSWAFGFYSLIYEKVYYTYSYNNYQTISTPNRFVDFIPIPYFGVTFKL